MTLPLSVVPIVRDVPTMHNTGVPPFGPASDAWPANPNQATIIATGTLPNRPTGGTIRPDVPAYFEFPITAAAANTQTLPDSGAGYIPGDVVNIVSRTTLAFAVTIVDAHGPTTLGSLPTTGTSSHCKLRFLGTQTGSTSWQVISIGGG